MNVEELDRTKQSSSTIKSKNNDIIIEKLDKKKNEVFEYFF